jgi:hypothetical protein
MQIGIRHLETFQGRRFSASTRLVAGGRPDIGQAGRRALILETRCETRREGLGRALDMSTRAVSTRVFYRRTVAFERRFSLPRLCLSSPSLEFFLSYDVK